MDDERLTEENTQQLMNRVIIRQSVEVVSCDVGSETSTDCSCQAECRPNRLGLLLVNQREGKVGGDEGIPEILLTLQSSHVLMFS